MNDDRRFWIATVLMIVVTITLYGAGILLMLMDNFFWGTLAWMTLWVVMHAMVSSFPAWIVEGEDDRDV